MKRVMTGTVMLIVFALLVGTVVVFRQTNQPKPAAASQSASLTSNLEVKSSTGLEPQAETSSSDIQVQAEGTGTVQAGEPSSSVEPTESPITPVHPPLCEMANDGTTSGCLPYCDCGSSATIACPLGNPRMMIAQPICPETTEN